MEDAVQQDPVEQVTDAQAESHVDNQQDTPPSEGQQKQQNGTPEWVTRRMGELAAARRAAEQRASDAEAARQRMEAELQAFRGGNPEEPAQPQQNVEQLARSYAEKMVRQQMQQQATASNVAKIEAAARKEFGADFDASVTNLQMAGVGGQEFVDVLASVPNAEKLITWLGKGENIEEAIRVSSLPPVQMAIEMTKLAGRATKEMGKQISKAPAPLETVSGGASDAGGAEPKIGSPEWFEWRNKNATRRRR